MDKYELRISRQAQQYYLDQDLISRLRCPHDVHLFSWSWPFSPTSPTDDGGRWRHWLREFVLLGFRLSQYLPDWDAMAGTIWRIGGSIVEWTSGPFGSRARVRVA